MDTIDKPRNASRFAESQYRLFVFLKQGNALPAKLFATEGRILLEAYYGSRVKMLLGLIGESIAFYWRWYVAMPLYDFCCGYDHDIPDDL